LRTLVPAVAVAIVAMAAADAASIGDAWFRALPGGVPAGGYFVLQNDAARPLTLVGASSPACGRLELHMTHNMGGMSHMMPVDRIEVPAHGTFRFAPGGYHLMCMNPRPMLRPGASVPVTLRFAGGATLAAQFAVRSATGN
jgi:periplasmic copper chaperone A